ncbi:MAG TPA: adenylosuccinate synthetase [Trebonia sp.]|nr:adenylosuccinate synthetase [Trebonia sp.]
MSARHVMVADLGYGDAGKGGIVDWLCSPPGPLATRAAARGAGSANRSSAGPVHTVVRYNGGAQAAHNVVTPDGRWHTFAQFGSGSFTAGTRTFLSRFMLVDPLAMIAEAEHLASQGVDRPLNEIEIDERALLTTPYHQAANQARERARGDGRHGSCGMGVGETAAYALRCPGDAPRAGDAQGPAAALERALAAVRDYAVDDAGADPARLPPPAVVADAYQAWAQRITITGEGHLARLLRRPGSVVFEGAQGVLLDEWRGFHPYTTWSTTTFGNAEELLAEAGQPGTALRLGVTRAYQVRHGPGPLVTEDPTLELAEPHNRTGRWQGPVRAGHLDAVTLRYAVEACGGVDAVALTHLDTARQHRGELRVARAYAIGERGRAGRLPLGPPRDLAYQERLTQMLLAARPVYDAPRPASDDDWAQVVARAAGAPVTIRSHGPSATAKSSSFRPSPATAPL